MMKWWGYLHINGNIQAKIYFDQIDIDEANESPFVDVVFGPFECSSRGEAISKIKEKINNGE